jgi:hypothetical protein
MLCFFGVRRSARGLLKAEDADEEGAGQVESSSWIDMSI